MPCFIAALRLGIVRACALGIPGRNWDRFTYTGPGPCRWPSSHAPHLRCGPLRNTELGAVSLSLENCPPWVLLHDSWPWPMLSASGRAPHLGGASDELRGLVTVLALFQAAGWLLERPKTSMTTRRSSPRTQPPPHDLAASQREQILATSKSRQLTCVEIARISGYCHRTDRNARANLLCYESVKASVQRSAGHTIRYHSSALQWKRLIDILQ